MGGVVIKNKSQQSPISAGFVFKFNLVVGRLRIPHSVMHSARQVLGLLDPPFNL